MKFKVLIKDSQGNILHEPEVSNLEEAQKHKELCEDFKNYPQFPMKKVIDKPEVSEIIKGKDAVLGKAGEVIEPAVEDYVLVHEIEESHLERDYTVEILDRSAEDAAEKSASAGKVLSRKQAFEALAAVNLNNVTTIAQLKVVVKSIIDKILSEV